MRIDLVTLFPAMLEGPLSSSIPGRVRDRGLAELFVHDLRQWGLGRHRSVDDAPYGGGAGMVLRPEPVAAALDALRRPSSTTILLDPAGEVFRQARAADLASREHLILVCPRYEGVDDRIRDLVDLELDDASTAEESFTDGLLEYPQYTRPAEFGGRVVPDVLVSGNHAAVRDWRLQGSLRRTLDRRPDLLRERPTSAPERRILDALAAERRREADSEEKPGAD
ncbi:MAG: trmD [Chloroflexi bacterium]|nr:trmD [Chloroflexota bacterium]